MPKLAVRLSALSASLRYKARRALGHPPLAIAAAAVRSWTLYPGGRFPAIRPVLPEGHLDRIICGATFNGITPSREQLLRELASTDHELFPLRVHELRDAVILDANVYAGRHKIDLWRQYPRHHWLTKGDAATVDSGVLATSYAGSRWFGHWLCDEAPAQLLAERLGPVIGHARPGYAHEPGYRKVFDLQSPPRYAACRIKRLLIVDEVAYNPDKMIRYRTMRERAAALPRGHDRIFIMRGHKWGEQRRLLNQDDVRIRLEREGFRAVNPEDHTVESFLAICNGAAEVIAAEGSHSLIGHFLLRPGGRFLSLHPANRTVPWSSLIAPFFNAVSGMHICTPEPGSPLDYRADPEELVRTLELTNRHAAGISGELEAYQQLITDTAQRTFTEVRPAMVQAA